MRSSSVWNPVLDGTLMRLRAGGAGWGEIAQALQLGRYTVMERGRRLGARRAPRLPMVVEDRDRPPRPAGHPDSWGLITAGTVLEGQAYPFPVFL